METIIIDGIEITYNIEASITNKHGIISAIGLCKDGIEYWIVYYPEAKHWEIERCMATIQAWRDYAFSLERSINSF